ncbi:MAG: hypothetical protein ACYSU0_05660 [Planctomycetota bacterium]
MRADRDLALWGCACPPPLPALLGLGIVVMGALMATGVIPFESAAK